MGISGAQSTIHSFSCRCRCRCRSLSLPPSLSSSFLPKAAYRIDVTRRLLHTCGEMTVRAARVGAGTGRGGRRRRCRGHRGSVDELEGGGGRVSDEGAETVDVGVGRGGERALSVRATQVHPGSCKHRHLSRFCDPREEIHTGRRVSGSPKSSVVARWGDTTLHMLHAGDPPCTVRSGRPSLSGCIGCARTPTFQSQGIDEPRGRLQLGEPLGGRRDVLLVLMLLQGAQIVLVRRRRRRGRRCRRRRVAEAQEGARVRGRDRAGRRNRRGGGRLRGQAETANNKTEKNMNGRSVKLTTEYAACISKGVAHDI